MRFAFLVSGAFGFFLVLAVGLGSGRDLEPVLRDAAVACLLSAFVGRWFWRGLEIAFARTLPERRAALEAAEAEAAAPAPAPATPPRAGASSTPSAKTVPSAPKPASPALAGGPRR